MVIQDQLNTRQEPQLRGSCALQVVVLQDKPVFSLVVHPGPVLRVKTRHIIPVPHAEKEVKSWTMSSTSKFTHQDAVQGSPLIQFVFVYQLDAPWVDEYKLERAV